ASTNPLDAAGTGAVSDEFKADKAGIYHVVATYSGDANYASSVSVCDEPSEKVEVTPPPATPPPPVTPPPAVTPPPPPAQVVASATEACTPPPGPAPAGGELCARGTAAIRGRTGCQGTPFRVTVSGREIERVVFTLDG